MYYFEKEVEKGFDPKYKVKYFHDEMDYKPTVKFFEFHNDMEAVSYTHLRAHETS